MPSYDKTRSPASGQAGSVPGRAARRRPQTLADAGAQIAAYAGPRARAMATRGPGLKLALRVIFALMARRLDPEKAGDMDAVIHWRISVPDEPGTERWQLVIRNRRAVASARLDQEPSLTLEVDSKDFIDLATGVVSGPELFTRGQLRVRGDLMLAARLQAIFRVPQPRVRRRR